MIIGERIAAEALALVGTPFRLRGRDPRTGIDCVGLAFIALRNAGRNLVQPPAYQLRGTGPDRAEALLRANGLVPAEDEQAGDIVLAESGPMQLHLMIRVGVGQLGGHVHAHAGLGRVVLMPSPAPWPTCSIWRVE